MIGLLTFAPIVLDGIGFVPFMTMYSASAVFAFVASRFLNPEPDPVMKTFGQTMGASGSIMATVGTLGVLHRNSIEVKLDGTFVHHVEFLFGTLFAEGTDLVASHLLHRKWHTHQQWRTHRRSSVWNWVPVAARMVESRGL